MIVLLHPSINTAHAHKNYTRNSAIYRPNNKNPIFKNHAIEKKQANSTLTLQLQVNQPQQERNTKIFQQIRYSVIKLEELNNKLLKSISSRSYFFHVKI